MFRFGQIWVSGFGVDEPRSAREFFTQAGLRLSLTQVLGDQIEGRVHAQAVAKLVKASAAHPDALPRD